ncbi:alpha/beta fold hydrolase [Streptomyces chiangmaiensis]
MGHRRAPALRCHGGPAHRQRPAQEVSRHDEDTAGLLEDFASQVVEVVSHLKRPQEPIVIVGQSMGGPVAELAATHLSDALAGLMLVTPAPLAGWPLPADAVETFKAGARELDRVTAALARTQLAVNTSDTTTLRIILSTPPETERASLQSLASWIGGHPLGRQPSRVTAPTLVVVTDDTFFPKRRWAPRPPAASPTSTWPRSAAPATCPTWNAPRSWRTSLPSFSRRSDERRRPARGARRAPRAGRPPAARGLQPRAQATRAPVAPHQGDDD